MIPLNPRVDDIINKFRKISSEKSKKYSRQDMKDLISLCLDGVVTLFFFFFFFLNIYIYIKLIKKIFFN